MQEAPAREAAGAAAEVVEAAPPAQNAAREGAGEGPGGSGVGTSGRQRGGQQCGRQQEGTRGGSCGLNHHRRKDADLLEGELKPVYGTAAATASASKQAKGTSAKAVAGQAAPDTARAVKAAPAKQAATVAAAAKKAPAQKAAAPSAPSARKVAAQKAAAATAAAKKASEKASGKRVAAAKKELAAKAKAGRDDKEAKDLAEKEKQHPLAKAAAARLQEQGMPAPLTAAGTGWEQGAMEEDLDLSTLEPLRLWGAGAATDGHRSKMDV
ncbi:hypothetical protein CYMTET_4683 [Cymbomonas tetramitiformis]|uniref:Uncharacterized protein n=1 Tax=Cymbomonas tetramitiformis TaxID=36881 RepID=A0AAE0LJU4_9CHLO|nr:hypothetical protein CYMTET_4683 [Cymbomonas tetramitiformis]